jgi:hypothetical protein
MAPIAVACAADLPDVNPIGVEVKKAVRASGDPR